MACEVDEGDHFGGLLADLGPVQAATVAVGFVDHAAVPVEAQDVVPNTAGATAFQLVFVSEELLPGEASTVVQFAVCQDAQQRALPGVHVPYHSHAERTGRRFKITSMSLENETRSRR